MTSTSGSGSERPDPVSFAGFIARALETDGLKGGVREAGKLLQGYDDREIRKAAEEMPSKVRTAVLKMVALRSSAS